VASVELKSISKCFENGTQALKDFGAVIEDGELVVLVGASGCGKSTLLRLLAGLENVSEGEILIDGRNVNRETPQQRNVAMVFQNYALYPHMTVRDNIAFPLRMSRTPKQRITTRVGEIADILQLSELMERRPAQLSGGQRQRVAMGRALVRDPSVFLLDEPLSNLDASLRAQIRAEISRIQKRLGTTTLYVTHDQTEAMTLGDRVVVLDHGELQQIGTPEELYQHPQNSFVARFIGSPGMNILPSELVDSGEGEVILHLGGQKISLLLEGRAYQELVPYFGQKLYAGIRPEALLCAPTHGSFALDTKVEAVEFLGYETLIYLSLPRVAQLRLEQPIIARLSGQHYKRNGDTAVFYVEPDALYFFNQAGRNILSGGIVARQPLSQRSPDHDIVR
jgi:multiple sugar transport system ATP-binding protein